MSAFTTDKTKFSHALHALNRQFHAFSDAAVRKGTHSKSDKRALLSTVSAAIDAIDTDDFGVRVLIVKTSQ